MTGWDLSDYAKQTVQLGLEENVRITSTSDFFQHLLPLHDEASGAISAIHERVKQKFWEDDRWVNFPTEEDDDEKYAKNLSLYHQSFVELANAVCQACTELGLVNDDCVQGAWVARPNNQSCENNGDADSFKALPDLVHISQETTHAAMDALCSAKGSEGDSEEKTLEKERMRELWWSQVRTLIEITTKPSDGMAMNKAVLQLCMYMNQVLTNQLDRRFTFGILICGEQLSLWFCDKSGLIGTLDPIHIHKDTMEIVRVLVALKTQSAYRLGWDPTMKVYQSPTVNGCPRDPIPSYRMVPEPADFTSITYQANWVISMPMKDNRDQREDFVTIRHPISANIAACTTTTIVWEVVKLKDIDKADRQIFILKQQWQNLDYRESGKGAWGERQRLKKDLRQHWLENNRWDKLEREKDKDPIPIEAEVHDQAGIEDRIWSAELVPDDTANTLSVRTDISDRTLEKAASMALKKSDKSRNVEVESESSVDMTLPSSRIEHKPHLMLSSRGSWKYDIFYTRIQSELKFKAQARLLLVNVGLHLGTFLDLLELLQAIRGAVKDHEKLYFSGVLHRDVSTGNILIFPKERRNNTEDEDCGMLIDFDHANRTWTNRSLVIHEPPSEEQCAALEEHFKSSGKFDREVLVHAWRYHGKIDTTIRFLEMLHYSEYGSETDDQDEDDLPTITMKQLGWETRHQWRSYVPKFDAHLDIIGTCYFMSARVANLRLDRGPWTHRVGDDTESFLWLVVFICMYYRGPGRERREELESEDTEFYKVMHEIFFDDLKDLGRAKHKLMTNPKRFKEMTLDRFHPYFDPLKGMVQKWYNIQRRLYAALERFNSNEEDHIHTYIQGLLDEAIEAIKRNPPEEEHPGTAKIRERRKKLLEEYQMLLRNVVPDQAHPPTSNRELGRLDADEDSEPVRKKVRLSGSQEEGDANEGGPAIQQEC